MGISDEEAKNVLLDKTDYRFTLAKYHLNRIDTTVSYNYDEHHFQQIYHMECYIMFLGMVIENMCLEIDKKFGFSDKDRIEDIIGNLRNSTEQIKQNILAIINDYFSRPPVNSGINDPLPDNTVLWQLRSIRNHVAHRPIINRAVVAGSKTDYLIRFPRDDGVVLHRLISNPRKDFEIYFDKMVEFRDKIRATIPQNYESSLYKNLKDSELKSSLS